MAEHQHIYYSFGLKPRKEKSSYDLPICEDELTVSRVKGDTEKQYVLTRIYSGNTVCTYVYNHINPKPASSATINCGMTTVNSFDELDGIDTIESVFTQRYLEFVTGGALLPVRSIQEIMNSGVDREQMLAAVSSLPQAIQRNEQGKNDLMEQVLCNKLSDDFIVTRKPLTTRKGMSVSPYSRSRPDITVQHKEKCFRSGRVMLASVASPVSVVTAVQEDDEGQSYTAVMEFKLGSFAKNQTLANMMCSGADGSVEILREGKQINVAIIYGFSVNYESNKSKVYKMILEFEKNSYNIKVLRDEVTLLQAINFMVTTLKK